jgi:T5orf172 domain
MAQIVYLHSEIDPTTGKPTGYYKLGLTTVDVEKRKSQYKAGNPRELRTVNIVEVPNAQESETALHRQYAGFNQKANGGGDEWLYLNSRELENLMRDMSSHGRVVNSQNQQKPTGESFWSAMTSGGVYTVKFLWIGTKFAFSPIVKIKRRDNLVQRIAKFPIAWILLFCIGASLVQSPNQKSTSYKTGANTSTKIR